MKTIGIAVGIGLVVLAIAGANTGANWSDGATRRADMRAQADIAVASRQAEAQMHAADRQAEAAMHAADAATQRTAIVVAALPVALLIIVAGGVLLVAVWYRGRAHLLSAQAMLADGGRPAALLPQPPREVLLLAQQRGAQPALIDGTWHLLVDDQVVARCRQLPGPTSTRR